MTKTGFYDGAGWEADKAGNMLDAVLWEDLRPVAADYVSACRRRINRHLPAAGKYLLDAGSGPLQYPEYLEYSAGFEKRYCVDVSGKALAVAKSKLKEKGEVLCGSMTDLPFPDNFFDATISMHAVYHIEKELQEKAVRQLVRVTREGARVIIVYANPDRFVGKVWRLVRPLFRDPLKKHLLYYFAHELRWWRRFSDECDVELFPWRSIIAEESKRLFPDNFAGRLMFRFVLWLENSFPRAAVSLGAYPLIILTKKQPAAHPDEKN